jgi:hypothetical protein
MTYPIASFAHHQLPVHSDLGPGAMAAEGLGWLLEDQFHGDRDLALSWAFAIPPPRGAFTDVYPRDQQHETSSDRRRDGCRSRSFSAHLGPTDKPRRQRRRHARSEPRRAGTDAVHYRSGASFSPVYATASHYNGTPGVDAPFCGISKPLVSPTDLPEPTSNAQLQ